MREIVSLLSRVVLGVVILGGVIRLSGEFHLHDDFNSVGVDKEMDRRLDAYVSLVRITRPLVKQKYPRAVELREVAKIWTDKMATGELETIMPAYHGEPILDGPKADAIRTCFALSNRLSELAVRESEMTASSAQAFADIKKSIQLVNLVRYGSAETMVCAATYLVKPTFVLENLRGKVDETELSALGATLIPKESDAKVVTMAHTERTQLLQYAVRYGSFQAQQDKNLYLADLAIRDPNPSVYRAFGPFAVRNNRAAQSFASMPFIAQNELRQ